MSGSVERGLRADLRKRGIKPNGSTLAATALLLAKRIDKGLETAGNGYAIEDKDLVSAMRELRLTVAALVQQPSEAKDNVTGLADSAAKKL